MKWFALLWLIAFLCLVGCTDQVSSGLAASSTTDRVAQNEPWIIADPLRLTRGVPVDLAATLPTVAKRGGTFSVSPTGGQLPPSITLSPAGILLASGFGSAEGVVIVYDDEVAP